jgi:uncharacterized membrane protein YfcA
MSLDLVLLFAAGLVGGMLNAVAGGGSFITFPALLIAGVPPVAANATNTFASCSGYLSGAYAFRKDLLAHRSQLGRFVLFGVIGGALGALLLMQTPDQLFRDAIPWLLLFAMLLFVTGQRLNAWLGRVAARHRHASMLGGWLLALLLLAVCTYGGFFNAGLGIVILSYLALAGYTDLHAMNGIKLLVSSAVSLVAIGLFIAGGMIAWLAGAVVLSGTLVGGFAAAHWSRRLPQAWVRAFVIIAGSLTTAYFFIETYGAASG